MKRKILIGLGVIAAIFFIGGVYVIVIVESTAARLDYMIMLHQGGIFRGRYLTQLTQAQTNLLLLETRHPKSFDAFVNDILGMEKEIENCRNCHHAENVLSRIHDLSVQTDEYKNALSRVLALRADSSRRAKEMEDAFLIGERLIGEVRDIVRVTSVTLAGKTEASLKEFRRTRVLLYLLIGAIPLLAGILTLAFIRELTRPVETLLDATRRLKRGNLDHRVEGLTDEFGELGASLNDMAEALKDQMQKMQRTEQMVVIAELAAGLGHEIKNPLAGIKVAMHVLSEETNLPEEDRIVLRRVITEVARLESLMKNFLNFATPPKPQLTSLNVNDILSSTLAFYLRGKPVEEGSRDGIRVEKDLRPLPAAMIDAAQLQQVFLNLVLNAVDAMPGGGTLGIRTCCPDDPGLIQIEISDTGKGLAEGDDEKIFQPFYTTKPKGTGLGLAISRQMIVRHGGSILARNNPGGGAIFRILLPISPPKGGAPA